MTTKQIYKIPVCELRELNNIFIEMTAKNCNQHCKYCYIDFPISKSQKDFISIDKVKQAIEDTLEDNIYCIYLTGAEPMMHNDFNSILRLCLRRSNVCICTNASFLNEKKIRFLKKVEDETDNEIIFMLPLVHYDEIKNDAVRSRGSFRQVVHASKILYGYDFNPIFSVNNFYNEEEKILISEFKKIFDNINIKVEDYNFQINQYFDKNKNVEEELINDFANLDCQYGRILTEKGVYACPFLANDHRGRMGIDFKDYGKKIWLETPYCITCTKNKSKMFSINYKNFQK